MNKPKFTLEELEEIYDGNGYSSESFMLAIRRKTKHKKEKSDKRKKLRIKH